MYNVNSVSYFYGVLPLACSTNCVCFLFRPTHPFTMGVITVTDIDYGHIFGPFPSHVTPADPAYLIGMLTNDKRPEGLMLKVRGRSYPVHPPVPALNNSIHFL